MKRQLPTLLILMVMALIGAMHWIDLSYYTNLSTGFVTRGTEWVRYAVLLLPILMGLLGLRTVSPRGIAVLRIKSPGLCGVFGAAGGVGGIYGIARLVNAIITGSAFGIVMGLLFIWYGVYMVLCAVQLATQQAPTPTKSAAPGILAALPFCGLAVYRVMVNPSSLYRLTTVVCAASVLLAMLWYGMLLRAYYVAMPQRRVKLMYFFGIFVFLFSTCLELPQSIHGFLFTGTSALSLLESAAMGGAGLAAGCLSVAVAGQSEEIVYSS